MITAPNLDRLEFRPGDRLALGGVVTGPVLRPAAVRAGPAGYRVRLVAVQHGTCTPRRREDEPRQRRSA